MRTACCTSFPVSAASCRPGLRWCESKATPRASTGKRSPMRCDPGWSEPSTRTWPYGFRLLVDMAERSLADSEFLDPTTAVQCIDRLHDGLRQLSGRVIPDGLLRDDDGTVRVTIPTLDWDAYVHLAFDEIRLAGATSPQISRRMRAALDDLLEIAPAARRPPLLRQLALLEERRAAVIETASRCSVRDASRQPGHRGRRISQR